MIASAPPLRFPDFARMQLGTGLREREATVFALPRQPHPGQPQKARTVLQIGWTSGLAAQHQAVQRRAAAGL